MTATKQQLQRIVKLGAKLQAKILHALFMVTVTFVILFGPWVLLYLLTSSIWSWLQN